MKKLQLQVKEFLQFRQVCEMYRIKFDYWYNPGGEVTVKASSSELAEIGY